MARIEIYDTTLRDGAQAEDISFSVEDKLLITEKLDELGIHFIEGGYPGANPRDTEYFKQAVKLPLKNSTIVAFGATHHPATSPGRDKTLRSILDTGAPAACVFGKTWDFHVTHALKISLEENLKVISRTVEFLKKRTGLVIFDAEHFFDGFMRNPEYAAQCLRAAADAGADRLVLCDTNGGTMPGAVEKITAAIVQGSNVPVGIHAHNDSECAVANSLVAIEAGARHVHGTINGLGERTGNANLCSILPALRLKLGHTCITDKRLAKLRYISRFVDEIANLMHQKRQPYVGDSSFAHKAGIHVSAILKNSETYEHIKPATVGNTQRILVSDLAGKSNVLSKAREFGIVLDPRSPEVGAIVQEMKELESQGYQFEGAEASFELLMKKAMGQKKKFFELLGFRVFISKRSENDVTLHEATVKIKTPDGQVHHTAGAGNGPVNALDHALRKALASHYPVVMEIKLLDYKVRVLDAKLGTAAKVRVLIESTDGASAWNTVGVSEDVVEASYRALLDSIEYKLMKGRH